MSRHRNVRNLTEDDYYDDDYYDDDYYEEEAHHEQEKKKKDEVAKKKAQETKKKAQAAAQKGNGGGISVAKSGGGIGIAKESGGISIEKVLKSGGRGIAGAREDDGAKAVFDSSPPPNVGVETGKGVTSGRKKSNPPEPSQRSGSGLRESLTPPRRSGPSKEGRREVPTEVAEHARKNQEGRSRLSMVVLGHVDAGKSTLMGQLLLQLGHVEKRTVSKYQRQAADIGKASFALAWVMDEDDAERERGVTMDVGTKMARTTRHDLTILDAPGHADFVPEMIAGAASADTGLLVVAATPGEFEAGFDPGTRRQPGGQTREHVVLARGLGVSQLIVAVNKLDAANPSWSQERFDYIKNTLKPFLKQNGFLPKRVRFIPMSGLNGINVKNGPGSSEAEGSALKEWYSGPTLVDAIDNFQPAQRNIEKPLRLIVSDVYSEGKGVTARGRVTQGYLCVGDRVVVLPLGDEALIGRIEHGTAIMSAESPYSFSSTSGDNILDRSKFAVAGDNVEVVLTGIDIARTSPGSILSHTNAELRPPVKRKFQAKILVMERLDVPIIRGAQVLMHMHSIDVPAVINKLVSTTKRDGSVKSDRPRVLVGGSNASVEITAHDRVCVEEFNSCRSLGRFILRRGGDTVAVGVIEKVLG